MIYKLHYAFVCAAQYAITVLLGGYLIVHTNATEFNLGFVFAIRPTCIFLRPLISAYADRNQSHKKLIVAFGLLTSFCYLPFVIWPFIKERFGYSELSLGEENFNWPFWILTFFHLLASIGFSGEHVLGDACAINFAKRTGTAFSGFRLYGTLTYGICGYLIGFVNKNNPYFPDFVPGMLLHCSCLAVAAVLVYLWPDEYFKMSATQQTTFDKQQKEILHDIERRKLPKGRELWNHVKTRLRFGDKSLIGSDCLEHQELPSKPSSSNRLLLRKQIQILFLLCKRDYRILLSLIVVFLCGLTALAGVNFVFVYVNEFCRTVTSCSEVEITSLMILGFSMVECLAYGLLSKINLNSKLKLSIIFSSGMLHHYFYGFLIESLSPYWFLIEAMHGIEYSLTFTLMLDLGYKFASEVDLIIPELIERGTISANNQEQLELTRVSLMATMSGLFTLMFDGISGSVGAVVYGQIAGHFSFKVLWIFIGSLASVGLMSVAISIVVARLFDIRPSILRNRDRRATEFRRVSDSCTFSQHYNQ